MKKIIHIAIFMVILVFQGIAQQEKTVNPPTFEQFFKINPNIFPGVFPVYQVGDKYYLEISEDQFNKDILIVGDIKNGTSTLAKSSGIIRFSKGFKNNLNISRNNYNERAVDNQPMSDLLSKSTLEPVSSVCKIESLGKKKQSYVIEITRQLIEGGDLFSFKNYGPISSPDPSRSGVEEVKPFADGVMFGVIRSQSNPGKDYNGKTVDVPITIRLELVIQQLDDQMMPTKYSDKRVGFATQSYIDFGTSGYVARKTNIIKKWNIQVKPEDVKKYKKGILVEPRKPIFIYLDQSIPKKFVNTVKNGILEWNKCFETAGFKNVLKIMSAAEGVNSWMAAGKVVVSWGGSADNASISMINDPRTGEIKTAKMSVSELLTDDLLPKYFVQCGAYDQRIRQSLYHQDVRNEILQFKVAQGMAEVLGMLPNLAGSAAYRPEQVSDPKWVAKHGFTSSITDNLGFNFLMIPGSSRDQVLFIPSVSSYDHFAVDWAYRQYEDKHTGDVFFKEGKINQDYYYVSQDNNNPLTQSNDLSSELVSASEMGISKLQVFYPKLESITLKMKDDTWDTYVLLATSFLTVYDQYVCSVLPNLGGKENLVVMKNYNNVPFKYTPKATQQKTFDFLDKYLFQGVPSWIKNETVQKINGSKTELIMLKTVTKVINDIVSTEMMNNLLAAENSGTQDAFGTKELFTNINHSIFKDFSTSSPTNTYTRAIQTKVVRNMIDVAAKNGTGKELNEISMVVNVYMESLIDHITRMSKVHQDPITREHYKLLKIQLDNEYLKNRI